MNSSLFSQSWYGHGWYGDIKMLVFYELAKNLALSIAVTLLKNESRLKNSLYKLIKNSTAQINLKRITNLSEKQTIPKWSICMNMYFWTAQHKSFTWIMQTMLSILPLLHEKMNEPRRTYWLASN